MPTDELTESGLTILTASTRLDQIFAQLRAEIDSLLQLSANDPTGQIARILNEKIQQNAELLQVILTAMDPDTATGVVQIAQATLTGTTWKPATQGKVTLEVTLDGGTILPAGSQAWADEVDETTVSTDVAVTAPAGPSDKYDVIATVLAYGNIPIPALTIDTIKTPISGWTNVTNLSDATPGKAPETSQELRERREEELTLGGSTSPDSLQAALSAITTIEKVIVKNNPRPISQDGMPPNTFESVISDGYPPATDNNLIAATIFREGPSGIQSYGSTVVPYTDAQGNVIDIGFTRAIRLRVELEFTLTTGAGYPGNDAFKAIIAAWDETNLSIGDDVIRSKLICAASQVTGVTDVVNLRLRFFGGVYGTSNLPVGTREIARIDAGDITTIP